MLIVDGYRGSRRALAALLRGEDYRVRAVATVREALAEIRRRPPSVMITELRLPRRGGTELIQAISGAGGYRPVCPVIVTTGLVGCAQLCNALGLDDPVIEAEAAGAYDILPKPIDFDALLAVIERATRDPCATGSSAAGERGLSDDRSPGRGRFRPRDGLELHSL